MGTKRARFDDKTSSVKLREDAEAAVSVLSPFSSPGRFRRKLSKYSKVVSPNVISYASDVIVSMTDKPTKSVYQGLEQTLNNIKVLLDWRVVKNMNDALEESLKESNQLHASNRAQLEQAKEAQGRARRLVLLREAVACRPVQARRLTFAGGRKIQAVPRP